MKTARYATSRQRACQNCSAAKAKCDRKPGGCARCVLRGLPCTYPQLLPLGRPAPSTSDNDVAELNSRLLPSQALLLRPECRPPAGADSWSLPPETTQPTSDNGSAGTYSTIFTHKPLPENSRLNITSRPVVEPETLDFSGLEPFSPINVNDISNRWLNSYIASPGQKIKEYPASVTAFVYRILKSYAAVTVRGRGVPPFVHPLQTTLASIKSPLSTCLSLVRICENPLPGSENAAADVLQREMSNLYEKHGSYDDMELLSAFQAHLIYSMVVFFRLGHVSNCFLRQAMTSLQDLACSSSRRGVMCVAEQQNARPRWEAWIVAEAKRRTLFAMYLFDSVLSAQDGLQTFLGTELQGLPAPSNKSLWRAETRQDWETAYNVYLADWVEGGLCIDELWPIPVDIDESSLSGRRNRVDQWLENVDEFGTMLYAVTSCTHGG